MCGMWRPSTLQARGSAAARSGGTDPAAAVQASASIDLPIPAGVVWDVLSDVEAWPRFLPGVSRVRITTPGGVRSHRLTQSSRFAWVNGGVPLRSRVEVVDAGRELTWTGRALWLVAVHRNTVEPAADGGCRLTSAESMAGAGAAWAMPGKKLKRELEVFVRAIGDEAGRRHEATATGTAAP